MQSLDKLVSRSTIHRVVERIRESQAPPALITVEEDLNDFVDERILMVIGKLVCAANAEPLAASFVRSLFGDIKETVVIAVESVVEEYRSLLSEFMPSPATRMTGMAVTPPPAADQSEKPADG